MVLNLLACRQASMDQRCALIRQSSGLWRSLRDGDFEEEDVWDVLRDRKDSTAKYGQSIESLVSVPRNLPTAARMIPRTSSSGSSSSHNYSSHEAKVVPQSAPVNIPDWSKICRKKTKKASKNATSSWLDDDDDGIVNDSGYSDDEDDDYDGEYNDKVPPHEFIARRLASSQIPSFSVFEGVGRTLKGRDLSKVRNAVLTKTGFLESL